MSELNFCKNEQYNFEILFGGVLTGLSDWLKRHQEYGNFPIFLP